MTQNIHTIIIKATKQLKSQSFEPESASFEAQLLLTSVLKVNRAWLIAHADEAINATHIDTFEHLLARRLSGEPIAYILGSREFYGLELKVTPDTLIPRPDTETLVEAALARISPYTPSHILDLGTGTGAIALALAKHRPYAEVVAVDASLQALKVAQENASNLQIRNVHFVLSDWFNALSEQKFDAIVSNPPFIEQNVSHLHQGDVHFEPLSALVSGQDGFDDIRHIIQHAQHYLKPQAWLMFEHGYNQAEQVAALLAEAGFTYIEHALDMGGIIRVTLGRISSHIKK